MNLNKLESRLNDFKSSSIKTVYSWMLTCTDAQLNTYVDAILEKSKFEMRNSDKFLICRMIERQDKQKELLDGCNNSIDYVAMRLNWDENAKEKALKNCPALEKCNMSKV